MNIPKGRFLSGTAIALSISFLSSCASLNINDNEPEEKSTLMQAVEEAADTAKNAKISEDGGKTIMSPPFFPPSPPKKIEENKTVPFSDTIDDAKEKSKHTPIGEPTFLQDYSQPEEP